MRHALGAMATLVLLVLAGPTKAEEKPFFFKSGDRIVFLGDSITEQYQYSTIIELYLTTRFPKWDLTFINAGIGGDTATGGASRFAAHVLAEKPTAVTIDFGMNDGGYGPFDKARHDPYVKNTEAMLKAAREAGVRVALMSPNAVDPYAGGFIGSERMKTYYETQKRFYAPLQGLAEKYRVPFVDQYAVTRAVLEKIRADGKKELKPFPDGVHTNMAGGLLMAHTILVGLRAPAEVSRVEIDAPTGKTGTSGCKVTNLNANSAGVSFDRLDEALPLPLGTDWVPLLPYVNQLIDLNWYGLQVHGLEAGKYTLHIDGKEVGIFSAEELNKGVNLGNLTAGPIHDQSQKVFSAINAKNELVHRRFRGVVMFNAPDWLADVAAERKPKELVKRTDEINKRQAEIYKMVQPVSRRFELRATK